jgi:hypothetical protein
VTERVGRIWTITRTHKEVNGRSLTGMFSVIGDGEVRFICLAKIGRNQGNNDTLYFSARRIFGNPMEQTAISSDVSFGHR